MIIKATAPVVKEQAAAITSIFYPKMLGRHPDLYRYFNESNQQTSNYTSSSAAAPFVSKQAKTLADAIVAYALNIEHLENLSEAVTRICHKHCALGIQPADYQLVHDNLVEAIGEVLGDAVTPGVAAAWSEAIMALAKLFIQTESLLYQEAASEQWTGPRDFVITEIISETNEIKSFRMVPNDDDKGICPFQPGQYISIFEKPAGKVYFAPRHYTLTSQPGDPYYQVSIKKMIGGENEPPGALSNYMHSRQVGDIVKLGPVFGSAPLQQKGSPERVACFVSVGIGITPTVAMLPSALKQRPNVAVFHADTSSATFAFQEHLKSIVLSNSKPLSGLVRAGSKGARPIFNVSFSRPTKTCKSFPFMSEGRLTGNKIVQALKKENIEYKHDVDYYICAGAVASPAIYKELLANGVCKDCLNLEYFGPFMSTPDEDNSNFTYTQEVVGMGCPFLLRQTHIANDIEPSP